VNALLGLLLLFAAFVLLGIVFGGEIWHQFWGIQKKRRMARWRRYSPRALMRRLRKQSGFQVDDPTVRDFILTIQLSLSLAETLAGALMQASRQFADRGVFGQRLQVRVRSQLQVEPERVVLALANDFQSPALFALHDRLELAHEGGLSLSEAVGTTLEEVEEAIRIEVEKEIERAPVMLTIPMIIGVFFASLALLGWPLLIIMFNTVGMSIGGGG
jgi:hypothetical protein